MVGNMKAPMRIMIAIIINVVLWLVFYNMLEGQRFQLVNTVSYMAIANIILGVITAFYNPEGGASGSMFGGKARAIGLATLNHNKQSSDGVNHANDPLSTDSNFYFEVLLKFIYVIIAIIWFITAFIVY